MDSDLLCSSLAGATPGIWLARQQCWSEAAYVQLISYIWWITVFIAQRLKQQKRYFTVFCFVLTTTLYKSYIISIIHVCAEKPHWPILIYLCNLFIMAVRYLLKRTFEATVLKNKHPVFNGMQHRLQHRLQPSLRLQQAPRWGFVCPRPSLSLLWKARWPFNGMVIVSYCCTNACARVRLCSLIPSVIWPCSCALIWLQRPGPDVPASCPRYRDFISVGVSEKIPRVVRKHEGAGSAQLGPVFKTPTWVSPGFFGLFFFYCYFWPRHWIGTSQIVEREVASNAAFIQHFPLHWLLSPQGKCFACVYVGERGRVCSPYMVM